MVGIDQVVDGIGEERRPAVHRDPPRRGVGRRCELRLYLGCGTERGIIEGGEIFLDRATGRLWRQACTSDPRALADVRPDQAGVDGKAFATDQPFVDAALQHGLEQPPQQIALPETAVRVLREGRVIRHLAFEPQTAEPAVGEVQVNLFA